MGASSDLLNQSPIRWESWIDTGEHRFIHIWFCEAPGTRIAFLYLNADSEVMKYKNENIGYR